MAGNYEQSMAQNIRCYREIILPELRKILKRRYEIYSIEADSSEISKILDVYGGIDLLLLNKDTSLVEGIASRIQIVDKSFDTFTIRLCRDNGKLTEYEKRMKAIKENALYPKYTFQAYVSPDMKLLNMAIVETCALFKYLESNQPEIKHTGSEQIGQASFIVVKWQDLHNAGVCVRSYPD